MRTESVPCQLIGGMDSILLDEGSWHTLGSAKVLLGIERICWMYVWANIAPIGITASIPESPAGGSRSAWNGGSVGLEEIELIDWIFIDSTTNHDKKHKKNGSCDEDEGDKGEGCS